MSKKPSIHCNLVHSYIYLYIPFVEVGVGGGGGGRSTSHFGQPVTLDPNCHILVKFESYIP